MIDRDWLRAHKLIDVNGRVNGPRLPHTPQDVIDVISEETAYLNVVPEIKLKHRIKALLLGCPDIKHCPVCGARSAFFDDSKETLFRRFCSDRCASIWARTDPESIQKLRAAKAAPESRVKAAQAAERGRASQIKTHGAAGFGRKDVQDRAQLHNQVCYDRSRSKYRRICVAGKEFVVQGYEHIFLENNHTLFDMDLLTSDRTEVPVIRYGANQRYFPDFFYPPLNTVYEIKSLYTLVSKWSNVIEKIRATHQHGYNFQLCLIRQSREEYTLLLDRGTSDDIEATLLDFLKTYYHAHPRDCRALGRFLSDRLDALAG